MDYHYPKFQQGLSVSHLEKDSSKLSLLAALISLSQSLPLSFLSLSFLSLSLHLSVSLFLSVMFLLIPLYPLQVYTLPLLIIFSVPTTNSKTSPLLHLSHWFPLHHVSLPLPFSRSPTLLPALPMLRNHSVSFPAVFFFKSSLPEMKFKTTIIDTIDSYYVGTYTAILLSVRVRIYIYVRFIK